MSVGIYPLKVDWDRYTKACPIPEDWDGADSARAKWLHSIELEDWDYESGPLDFGPWALDYISRHAGREICAPAMHLLVPVGAEVEGWATFSDDPHGDETNYHFGANLPPQTVKKLLEEYDAVDQDALLKTLREHWPELASLGREAWWSEDALFWFPTADDFLKYVNIWRNIYAEAAKDGHGLLTGYC